MKEGRPPSEIAAVLNAEFQADGLNVTPRQLSEYASTRNWGTKRKALRMKGEAKASQMVTKMANDLAAKQAETIEKHKDFLETSVRLGGKIMTKAETIIGNATSARDLASAANAAAKGIEIYRKAVGIDDASLNGGNGAAGSGNTFIFNFARSADSPFSKPAEQNNAEQDETIIDADEETESEHPLAPQEIPSDKTDLSN